MNIKYILIVMGEPYSTFSEIIGKYFSKYNLKRKIIILIGNISLLEKQLNKLNYKINLYEIKNVDEAKRNKINIININFKFNNIFSGISKKSSKYIENSFKKSLEIIRLKKNRCVLINGPISKKSFLQKKYLGITEYLSEKTNKKNEVMLIYNQNLSVTPITTHIPIKYVSRKIKQNKIKNNILKINNFFENYLKKKPRFAVLGLNPHCETVSNFSEEDKIIIPSIRKLRKDGIKVDGPFSADTFFIENNIKYYNVVVGMYHDQVLTPIKTLYKFDAINITIGLPFLRISPDHGPNYKMLGKNLSDPSSFMYAMKFVDKLK